jgi:hypothetical protein
MRKGGKSANLYCRISGTRYNDWGLDAFVGGRTKRHRMVEAGLVNMCAFTGEHIPNANIPVIQTRVLSKY